MNRPLSLDGAAIRSIENGEVEKVIHYSSAERGKLLAAACRSAVEIETSRRKMGLPPSEPSPWPDSTWKFLAEATRRARER